MIQLAKSSLGDWICLIQVDEMKNCYILSATTKKRYKTKKPWIKDFINQSIKNQKQIKVKKADYFDFFFGVNLFFWNTIVSLFTFTHITSSFTCHYFNSPIHPLFVWKGKNFFCCWSDSNWILIRFIMMILLPTIHTLAKKI